MVNTKRHTSLYVRLGLSIVTMVVAIMSLHSAYSYHHKRGGMVAQIQTTADRALLSLESNIGGLIASYAVNEYERLVITEMERQDNYAILVADYNMGKVMGGAAYRSGMIRQSDGRLVEFDPDDAQQSQLLEACCYQDHRQIIAPSGEVVGKVTVYLSEEEITRELNKTIFSTFTNALIISLLHIIFLFAAIRSFVLKPVIAITETISDRDEQGMPRRSISDDGPQEVRALGHTINDMVEMIRQANLAKERFLAAMSHELRTPLTSIIGNSQLLRERTEESELKDLAHSVEVAGRSQLSLVDDILDITKIEADRFSLIDAPYDLAALLDDLRKMALLRARNAGLELVIEQLNQEEYRLVGDRGRIIQILGRLIDNAIKFSRPSTQQPQDVGDDGRGEIRLTSRHLGNYLVFSVEDRGIGIVPERLEQIFERFCQADSDHSRRYGGSGNGLYLSNLLAELMGGHLDASSRPGYGSIFQLVLPYRPSTESTASKEDRKQPTEQKLSGRVLVAEDTPALQLLERRILEGVGLMVSTVENGEQAIESVLETTFDLVIMDMQMPVMDGIEATRELRRRGVTVPIVALTANVLSKHREAFSKAGCNVFLEKPIDRRALREVLCRYLKSGE